MRYRRDEPGWEPLSRFSPLEERFMGMETAGGCMPLSTGCLRATPGHGMEISRGLEVTEIARRSSRATRRRPTLPGPRASVKLNESLTETGTRRR